MANTTIAGNQFVRSVDALAAGGYAVSWSSQSASGATSLLVQRYDAQGAKSGGETRIAYDVAAPESPAVAVLRDGSVVVASAQSRPDWVVFVRRFDASGNAFGAETLVASQSQASLAQPMVLALDDGGFAVGWASVQGDGRAQHVQRFDAQAHAVGAPTDFAAAGVDRNVSLKLVRSPGGFVAGTTHRFNGIPYVQFTLGGNVVGALDDANTGLPEFNTVLLALADGRFALWSTGSNGGYMQMLDANGRASGSATQRNAVPDTAAAIEGGGWVTVTRQMQGEPGVAQQFDASGAAVGAAVQTAGDFSRPLPTVSTTNGLALAWTFTGAQGDADVKTQSLALR